jgi:catechol 2,3-dioxygenase-like lactoylglutathione lyase family enzyme
MSVVSSPLNLSSPFASWRIEHVGVRVPDFDDATAWYREKLDFRVRNSWPLGDKIFAFISPAGNDSLSLEVIAGPGAEPRPSYRDLPDSHKLSGWHHICFTVDNVRESIAELKSRGVTIISEPRDVAEAGLRFAFFADPWGNLFEVSQSIRN